MWQELLSAVALVLVLEGLMPFIAPDAMRRVYRQMAESEPSVLRMAGLVSMIAGVVLLYLVR